MHFQCRGKMKVTFSIKDTEGNELKVSLCSFNPEASKEIQDVLGTTDLIDISLERNGNGYIESKMLVSMVEIICDFLQDNKDCILYYYCDEINEIPRMRRTKTLSPSEYRNKLFTLLFKKEQKSHTELPIIDRDIEIDSEQGQSHIHLIYFQYLEDKADRIEQELRSLSNDLK